MLACEADEAADAQFLMRLACQAERFTPLFALDEPYGLMLDVTGCAHLFGGEAAMRRAVAMHYARQRLSLRTSLAATPDTARALARFSNIGLVPPGEDEAFVRALPVAALEAGRETLTALKRAGLKTLGDLADRPSVLLSARFGEELSRRLFRMLGREDRRLTPLRPAPPLFVERRFAEPMTHREGLEAALVALADEMEERLEARGEGGRTFEARFFRSDGEVKCLTVETGRPVREPAALLLLFRERLESLADPLDAGHGYDALRLSVPVAEALAPLQRDLDGHAAEAGQVLELIERLSVRLGTNRVRRFTPRDSHKPERASASVPALGEAGSAAWPALEEGEPPLRPLFLFSPPQAIEVLAEVPDGPPLKFRWRRVLHEVVLAEGPERIAPEWWRKDGAERSRDYYRIEDAEGRRFWVFRAGLYEERAQNPFWFLHGLFA